MNNMNKNIVQCVGGAWMTVAGIYWTMLWLFNGRVDQALLGTVAAMSAPTALMWLASLPPSPDQSLATLSFTSLTLGVATVLLFGRFAVDSQMMLFLGGVIGAIVLISAYLKDLEGVKSKKLLVAALGAEMLAVAATLSWLTPVPRH